MKHDYSKAIAVVGIWMAVAAVALYAPEKVVDVVGYAVGGTFIVAFFL